jgi:hypothetical protein
MINARITTNEAPTMAMSGSTRPSARFEFFEWL